MDKVGAMGSTLVNALISVGRLTDDHESRPSSARRTYCPAAEGSANRRQIAGDTIFNRPTFVESDDFRSSSLQDFFLSDPFQKFGTGCFENIPVLDCSDSFERLASLFRFSFFLQIAFSSS